MPSIKLLPSVAANYATITHCGSRVAARQRRTVQALEQRVAEQTGQLMRANEDLALGSGSYARSPRAVKPPNTSSANARRMPGRMTHHHRR